MGQFTKPFHISGEYKIMKVVRRNCSGSCLSRWSH